MTAKTSEVNNYSPTHTLRWKCRMPISRQPMRRWASHNSCSSAVRKTVLPAVQGSLEEEKTAHKEHDSAILMGQKIPGG